MQRGKNAKVRSFCSSCKFLQAHLDRLGSRKSHVKGKLNVEQYGEAITPRIQAVMIGGKCPSELSEWKSDNYALRFFCVIYSGQLSPREPASRLAGVEKRREFLRSRLLLSASSSPEN